MKIGGLYGQIIYESLDNVWYHGSNNRFNEFENSNNRTYKEIDVPSWFFTKDLTYAKSYGKYIYTVKLLIQNIFDTNNQNHMGMFINQLKEWNYSSKKIDEILSDEFVDGLPYWTCNDAIYVAAMNKFDSIHVQEELERDVLAVSVFDNTKIKILSIN